jgi:hypothetical protein
MRLHIIALNRSILIRCTLSWAGIFFLTINWALSYVGMYMTIRSHRYLRDSLMKQLPCNYCKLPNFAQSKYWAYKIIVLVLYIVLDHTRLYLGSALRVAFDMPMYILYPRCTRRNIQIMWLHIILNRSIVIRCITWAFQALKWQSDHIATWGNIQWTIILASIVSFPNSRIHQAHKMIVLVLHRHASLIMLHCPSTSAVGVNLCAYTY